MTLFNQWEGALVFIKRSPQWWKIFTTADRVAQILRWAYSTRLCFTFHMSKRTFHFRAKNHWGVRTDSGTIAEVVASLSWLARFLIEANWSRVKIVVERVWKLLRSYKTGLVLPINFYRTRIKEPVIITRIKSSSNLLIFLVCFFVLFRVDFTHLVLSLLAVVPAMF